MSSINKIQPASDKLSSLLEDDFVGEWNRTNTYMAYTGIITIKNLTDKSFDFSFNGFYGANSGTIDGTAVMTDKNKAEFKYVPEYDETVFAKVEFVFEKDSLLINLIEGDESALGFGHNVFIEGEYTKSEPIYLDANIINEILPTDEIKEKIRTLLGDDVYEQMVFVIEYGIRYKVDGLTYSGFISGAGEGVDLLINDNNIYCLGYGLDADGFVYKLYTNDQDYKDKLPPFMKIERPDYKLQFVYKP
ncbi:MAG: hypothetical protein H6Q59_1721 [Firmicutes bacterium]|nr:hypothetical protein [Bacillota bacterium]